MRRHTLLGTIVLSGLCIAMSGCMVAKSTYLQKSAEADGLTKQVAELKQQQDALNASLAQEKSEHAKTRMELKKVTVDRNDLDKVLKSKSDELSKAIQELRTANASLEAENAKLKDDFAREVAENVTLAQGLESIKQAREAELASMKKAQDELMQEMKSEVAKGQVTITELKGKLTVDVVDEILFDSGKAEMKPEGLAVLQRVIDILKHVKDKTIRIEGHTDNVPIGGALAKKYPTNWELSAARAINITRHLEEVGVNPSVLSAAAYGQYKPIADNGTPEGRAKNRRIAIILLPKD